LELGNLESQRDWGYAPEYVEAMWLMLQQEKPEDYVIATNETHTIKEFLNIAFDYVGLNWENYISVNEKFIRPVDVRSLKGNYSKSLQNLGWKPKVQFKDLVEIMVKSDLERGMKWQKGEHYAWDAWNYPNEKRILSRKLKLER